MPADGVVTEEERDSAYRKLRAAAHRLLCDTYDLPNGRVACKSGKIAALDRALTRADELEDRRKDGT